MLLLSIHTLATLLSTRSYRAPTCCRKSHRFHTVAMKAAEAAAASSSSSSSSYFLMKSEPHVFSIDDLAKKGQEEWDGVRNYAARNVMRSMKVGDSAWFYHSNCDAPGIVGRMTIARQAEPDKTALDPSSEGYDPKSTRENCRWDSVLVEFAERYKTMVTLKEIKAAAKSNETIAGMKLLKLTRMSVTPVTEDEWNAILELMKRKEAGEDLLAAAKDESAEGEEKRQSKRQKRR